ncbi:hypothetical protein Tco_0409190 [Tanacetum coccineum]
MSGKEGNVRSVEVEEAIRSEAEAKRDLDERLKLKAAQAAKVERIKAALQVAEAKYARLKAASEVSTKVHAQKVAERKAIKRKQADALIEAYKSEKGLPGNDQGAH